MNNEQNRAAFDEWFRDEMKSAARSNLTEFSWATWQAAQQAQPARKNFDAFMNAAKEAGITALLINAQQAQPARGPIPVLTDAQLWEIAYEKGFADAQQAQPAARPLSDEQILEFFKRAGMNFVDSPNRLYSVRGQLMQLVIASRALLAARSSAVPNSWSGS